jgi:hypothetical protein
MRKINLTEYVQMLVPARLFGTDVTAFAWEGKTWYRVTTLFAAFGNGQVANASMKTGYCRQLRQIVMDRPPASDETVIGGLEWFVSYESLRAWCAKSIKRKVRKDGGRSHVALMRIIAKHPEPCDELSAADTAKFESQVVIPDTATTEAKELTEAVKTLGLARSYDILKEEGLLKGICESNSVEAPKLEPQNTDPSDSTAQLTAALASVLVEAKKAGLVIKLDISLGSLP